MNSIFFKMLIIMFIACVPPEDMENSSLSQEEKEARNKECDIYLSFATTNYQNRGLGNKLLDFLIMSESIKNVERIYLMTTNCTSFYQQIGFKSCPRQTLLMKINIL